MTQKYINDYLQRSFCPQEESRILSQMIHVSGNGIQYIYYKKFFDTLADRISVNNQEWFILTLNGYYDLAVYNWCMIFGTYSEPTHYQKLIEYKNIKKYLCCILSCETVDKEIFKNHLLDCIGLSESEYVQVHKNIIDYRNRYLAHRVNHPSEINDNDLVFPELNVIKQALEFFYLLLVQIINFFPDTPDKNNRHYVSYFSLNSHDDIEEFLKLTLPNFDNLPRNTD